MNLLADSNFLIHLEREFMAEHVGPARQLLQQSHRGYINAVAYCEFLSRGENPLRFKIAAFFLRLPLDFREARLAGRLRWERAKRGKTLSTPDALMAATAIRHGLRLVTADKDFSGIPGLDWSSYPASKTPA